MVEIGTWVEPGDTLVGKISPQKDSENTPEGRLLRAIFGGTARDVKDTPLTVPNGVTGRVLEIRTLFDETTFNEQVKCSESVGAVYVFLVQNVKYKWVIKLRVDMGIKGLFRIFSHVKICHFYKMVFQLTWF